MSLLAPEKNFSLSFMYALLITVEMLGHVDVLLSHDYIAMWGKTLILSFGSFDVC